MNIIVLKNHDKINKYYNILNCDKTTVKQDCQLKRKFCSLSRKRSFIKNCICSRSVYTPHRSLHTFPAEKSVCKALVYLYASVTQTSKERYVYHNMDILLSFLS